MTLQNTVGNFETYVGRIPAASVTPAIIPTTNVFIASFANLSSIGIGIGSSGSSSISISSRGGLGGGGRGGLGGGDGDGGDRDSPRGSSGIADGGTYYSAVGFAAWTNGTLQVGECNPGAATHDGRANCGYSGISEAECLAPDNPKADPGPCCWYVVRPAVFNSLLDCIVGLAGQY